MAEEPFYSSQGSQYDRHKIGQDQGELDFSPQKPIHGRDVLSSSVKPKKPPTVTPKRFNKFFTPRPSLSTRAGRQSKAGRQLRDITKNGANRRRYSGRPQCDPFEIDENVPASSRAIKRRKVFVDLAGSPPQSSPLKYIQPASPMPIPVDATSSPTQVDHDALLEMLDPFQPLPKPIRRLRQQGPSQRILQRSFGGYDALSRGYRGFDHCTDWHVETANFVSTPGDIHAYHGTALPFCTTGCNTNSLVAIGDEEGSIRLIDSSSDSDFTKAHVLLRPHRNAVMDIAFSPDDFQLATASGDQTARIIDMHTQQTLCILSGHQSSVKQVRFQPHDENMITTSSRDGSVMVWDLRCAAKGSVQNLRTAFARAATAQDEAEPAVRYAKETVRVGAAHRSAKQLNSDDTPVSITTIQHLPNGREHLLLTATELNASVKMWDLRNISRTNPVPLSSTPLPESHARTRNFGINALLLSADGARIYTVCRDATVYVYSANHLMLGSAPDFSPSTARRRMPKDSKTALGPLYAFKHPQFRAGSFYVKAAVRQARGDRSEVIAVGSSESCSVFFPTDERHLQRPERRPEPEDDEPEDEMVLPTAPRRLSQMSTAPADESSFPIYEQGTALIRGHGKEVTSLTWSHDGDLITIGDDYRARCWRENAGKARELRRGGEGGGQRWGFGWADVEDGFDEEDG